jgi:hypothetical protein
VRWEWVVVIYAGYFAAVAWSRGYPAALRYGTLAAVICASAFALLPSPTRTWTIAVRTWMPVVLLLGGYRLSGLFYVAPMTAVEARLLAFDRRVFETFGWTAAGERHGSALRGGFGLAALRGALEFAYLFVYVMVPLGAVVLYFAGAADQLPRYWTVVLTACFACYAMLPWVQTRPPRVLEGLAPGSGEDVRDGAGPLRRLNLAILLSGSNQVNTVPSGHVAAALAVALTLLASAPAAGLAFLALTAAIALATIVGRYHYTVDTVAGLGVALASWWWLG